MRARFACVLGLGLAWVSCSRLPSQPSEPETEAPTVIVGVPEGCDGALDLCLSAGERSLARGKPILAEGQMKFACKQGLASACHRVAWALGTGEFGERDLIESIEYLQQPCVEDDLRACLMIGRLLGQDPAVDPPRAMRALQKACEGKVGAACDLAGHIALNELGAPAMARRYWDRGCSLEQAGACVSAGRLLAEGVHLPVDLEAANSYQSAACELDRTTCSSLDEIDGVGVQRPSVK